MLIILLDEGDIRVVQWGPHPYALIEWGPIKSKAGGGHLDASNSEVFAEFFICVGTILG